MRILLLIYYRKYDVGTKVMTYFRSKTQKTTRVRKMTDNMSFRVG